MLLRWPDEQEQLPSIAAKGQPRLLLVGEGAVPPDPVDCLEDWIRMPAAQPDVRARVAALARRAGHHGVTKPQIDADGVVRVGSRWVHVPPVEARLVTAMVERFGAVVSREALTRAGWPAGAPDRNVLDVHVLRLRRRLDPVGLVIRTVRSRGYLLELAETSALVAPA